jgi:hypothetical protein
MAFNNMTFGRFLSRYSWTWKYERPTTGFDDTQVVKAFPDFMSETAYKCPVCLCIPRFPVSLRQCGHMFCEQCIRSVLTTWTTSFQAMPPTRVGEARCPVCRYVFRHIDFVPFDQWPLFARIQWKSIQVQCINMCGFTSDPLTVASHETRLCPKRRFKCLGSRCLFVDSFEVVDKHCTSCSNIFIYCTQCQFPIQYIARNEHKCDQAEACARAISSWNDNIMQVPWATKGIPGDICLESVSIDDHLEEMTSDQIDEPSIAQLVAQAEVEIFSSTSSPIPQSSFVTPPNVATPAPRHPDLHTTATSGRTQATRRLNFGTTLADISNGLSPRSRRNTSRSEHPTQNAGRSNEGRGRRRRNIFE